MPIYEYVCNACGHELEKLQKISDEPLLICPECSGETLQKKVSAAGFRLKGSGWYETDFKNKGRPEKPNSKGADDKSSNSTSNTNSQKNRQDNKKSSTTKSE